MDAWDSLTKQKSRKHEIKNSWKNKIKFTQVMTKKSHKFYKLDISNRN